MTIKLRLSGEPDEIDAMVAHLSEGFEVAGGDRAYPNRGSFGVRVYLEVRPRGDQPPVHRVQSERVHPSREEIEP
ncbi:hypothetical protein [Kribbella sp. VKM Ac-2568]|uniref:hypothetical protein n=1 Tax=Kribbella sp. VKM Ac-2568 TaxID=2512219 RepID=UPI0010434976|nr:hypothetical protein [Kribbella sp. VKM Ac-2568]TCM35125.1 hypothetical protein EV648_12518 [Kribbella sp. VKM Ac-2568]